MKSFYHFMAYVSSVIVYFIYLAPYSMGAAEALSGPFFSPKIISPIKSDTSNETDSILLIEAMPCQNCSEDLALFLVNQKSKTTKRITYPGKILDPKSGTWALEVQAYYGRCLPTRSDAVITINRERITKKRTKRIIQTRYMNVFTPENGAFSETSMERSLPSEKDLKYRKKLGQCFEIAGRDRRVKNRNDILGLVAMGEETEKEDADTDETTAPEQKSPKELGSEEPLEKSTP